MSEPHNKGKIKLSRGSLHQGTMFEDDDHDRFLVIEWVNEHAGRNGYHRIRYVRLRDGMTYRSSSFDGKYATIVDNPDRTAWERKEDAIERQEADLKKRFDAREKKLDDKLSKYRSKYHWSLG
jgi:hypothetical protein